MTNVVFNCFMNIFIRGIGNFEERKVKYKSWIKIPKMNDK